MLRPMRRCYLKKPASSSLLLGDLSCNQDLTQASLIPLSQLPRRFPGFNTSSSLMSVKKNPAAEGNDLSSDSAKAEANTPGKSFRAKGLLHLSSRLGSGFPKKNPTSHSSRLSSGVARPSATTFPAEHRLGTGNHPAMSQHQEQSDGTRIED